MAISNFRAQLEEEFEWRVQELRFFQNSCEFLQEEDAKNKFRRALVVMLYSHFEGYCKFALTLYVSAVNTSGAICKDATAAVIAASLHDVFYKLRDGKGKAPEFRNSLPDDTGLHRFARDREFVERSADIMARPVLISDRAVDTESNLKPAILRRILYRLGLPHDQFSSYDDDIDRLLSFRNRIAHGESRVGIGSREYERLRDGSLNIMTGITLGITKAIDEKWFLTAP